MISNIKQTDDGYEAQIDGKLTFVPADPSNRHYQMLEKAISEGASVEEKNTSPDPKMQGIEFDGVMCSATADDQNGLAAVLVAIQFQGAAFEPTRFHFANGNTLVLTLQNYQAFAAVWLPFRQSFFTV